MAVKGAVLGDMIGAQYEFKRPSDLDWQNVPLVPAYYQPHCTDDSVMTLAVKKAILTGKNLVPTMVSLGRKFPNCGFGRTFAHWIMGDDHFPYNSWGNGSAMRVSFVGEYFDDYEQMQEVAKVTANVSHNHPEGIKGAVVTATCVWMAKHGKSKQDIFDYVLCQYPEDEYQFSIARSLDEIRPIYEWSVSCMDTVPVAMRCFYESEDYESFMRNIFSLECDSDTFGSVAGGVAEEFYQGFGNIDVDSIFRYLPVELYQILIQ